MAADSPASATNRAGQCGRSQATAYRAPGIHRRTHFDAGAKPRRILRHNGVGAYDAGAVVSATTPSFRQNLIFSDDVRVGKNPEGTIPARLNAERVCCQPR